MSYDLNYRVLEHNNTIWNINNDYLFMLGKMLGKIADLFLHLLYLL